MFAYLVASNLFNNYVITVSLARTYRGIPSSSFEIEAIPPSPVGFTSGNVTQGSYETKITLKIWNLPINMTLPVKFGSLIHKTRRERPVQK